MWDEWSCPQLFLLWGLSDPRIAELHKMPQCFSIKLHSEYLGMSGDKTSKQVHNPYSASEGKHYQYPTMSYHPTLTSSSVHHSFHQQIALFLTCYSITKKCCNYNAKYLGPTLTPRALSYSISIFSYLKLCLATAIHNFKKLYEIYMICEI